MSCAPPSCGVDWLIELWQLKGRPRFGVGKRKKKLEQTSGVRGSKEEGMCHMVPETRWTLIRVGIKYSLCRQCTRRNKVVSKKTSVDATRKRVRRPLARQIWHKVDGNNRALVGRPGMAQPRCHGLHVGYSLLKLVGVQKHRQVDGGHQGSMEW